MPVHSGVTTAKSNDRLSRHSWLRGRKFLWSRDRQSPAGFAPPRKTASRRRMRWYDWPPNTSHSRHFLLCDRGPLRAASEWIWWLKKWINRVFKPIQISVLFSDTLNRYISPEGSRLQSWLVRIMQQRRVSVSLVWWGHCSNRLA